MSGRPLLVGLAVGTACWALIIYCGIEIWKAIG
jgi:hypothetical protein